MLRLYNRKTIQPLQPLIPVKAFMATATTPNAFQLAYRTINITTGEVSQPSPKSTFYVASCPNTALAPTVVRFPKNAAVERAIAENAALPEIQFQIILYVNNVPYIFIPGVNRAGITAGPEYQIIVTTDSLNPVNLSVYQVAVISTAEPPDPPLLEFNLGDINQDASRSIKFDVETTNDMVGIQFSLNRDFERFYGVLSVSVEGVYTNTSDALQSKSSANTSVTLDKPQRSSNFLPLVLGPGSIATLKLSVLSSSRERVVSNDFDFSVFSNIKIRAMAIAKHYPVEPHVAVPLSLKVMGNSPLNTFYSGIYTVASGVATLQRDVHINTQGRCIVLPKGYRFRHPESADYSLTIGLDGDIRQRELPLGDDPIGIPGHEEVIFRTDYGGWTVPAYCGKLVALTSTAPILAGAVVYLTSSGNYTTTAAGNTKVGVCLSSWRGNSFTMLISGVATIANFASLPVICVAAGSGYTGGGTPFSFARF